MAFVTGPRQVGKTTTCRALGTAYLDWDDDEDRRVLLAGAAAVAERVGLDRLRERRAVVVLDELHKFRRWKAFLKGFFDAHEADVRVIVTGSSRMDRYRKRSDSLMGRYLTYRMHPFSVAELVHRDLPDVASVVRPPAPAADGDFAALLDHGGFPEPFLARDARFTRRWGALRREQLVRGDVRDQTRLEELGQVETLARLLEEQSGGQLGFSRLAGEVQVSVDTIRRWIDVLCGFHLGFVVRPWYRNVARSLRKEPKWYLRDWTGIDDPGRRAETLVACHLLKAVEGWQDLGLGDFRLGYVRDKEKREVDFVVVRDRRPWFLVEVKHRDDRLAPSLARFQEALAAPFAFQVVLDAPYVASDCFARPRSPLVVPARTFLSQLL
jgi:predicted AAA+ superfamily ATPase